MRRWRAHCVAVAAAAFLASGPGDAQQGEAVQAIGDLVNQGLGAVAAMRDDIYDAERRLSELEETLLRSSSRSAPNFADGPSPLAAQIARHPLVLTTNGFCKDAFQELIVETLPARPDVISTCIEEMRPRTRHKARLDCATLHWVVAPNGQLRLEGHVSGTEDYAQLAALYGAQTVATVVERPFPACAALEALELPMTSNARPDLRILSDETRVAFSESLAFEVKTPDFFAYVYVVYLQADGSVVNLTPKTRLLREQYRPNSVLRFGDGLEWLQTYTASAPAGSEAIIVVASRSPIDSLDTLEIGPQGQYALRSDGTPLDQSGFLNLLRRGMEQEHSGRGTREISAEVLHITVVP